MTLQNKFFSFVVLAACTASSLFSQERVLPLDAQVRTGKLENGLTYYIRKNTTRPQLADFYIAQKVGSIQETPQQRGLAHFLEHMAFNGTTHFPGKELISWCEKIGVNFGYNLNAYTSVDETVYRISDAPVTRGGVVDSCLLILHDWSNDLLLQDEEIDKERGVIHEEWRTRQDASMRMYERVLPVIYKGSKYADCWPIGNMEVVNNFKYQELRDYYEKWYRPDLQGLVIVGDIDPEEVEQKIRTLFADVPAQPDAAERIYYTIGDHTDPIVLIETDKEMPATYSYLYFARDPFPDSRKSDLSYWIHQEQVNMISSMLNERLYALQQKADAPFLGAATGETNYFIARAKSAFEASMGCKEGKVEDALAATYREILRAARHGFTESELARMKQEMMSRYEIAYNERNTQKNDHYSTQYVRHFLDNEPAMDIEYEYKNLARTLLPGFSLDTLNRMMKEFITPDNRAILVFGPEKEGLTYPTPKDLVELMKRVEAETIEPYEETLSNEPLVGDLPDTGKITEEKEGQAFGTTVLTLSNGMKIYIKPTDFKTDEVMMRIQRKGGNSLYPDEDALNWRCAIGMIQEGGLGNYSKTDLMKKLSGKQAWANAWMSTHHDGIQGGCVPRDFETMMQLTYLIFTSPRTDPEASKAWRMRTKEQIRNEKMHPLSVFHDSIRSTMYGYNERIRRINEEEIDRIDYDRCMEIYQNTYADASDYSVRIVGNVNIDSIRPLLVKYLGALPSLYTQDTWKETSQKERNGLITNHFTHKQEIPAARVFITYHEKMEYTFRNFLRMSMLRQVLNMEYMDKVREEEGGTYGVQVNGWQSYEPYPIGKFQIMYETAPEKESKLTPILYNEIERFQREGPDPEKLAKAKEFMLKHHINEQRENSYWDAKISDLNEYNMDTHTEYEELIRSVTADELRTFAEKLFGQKNRMEVIMTDSGKKE